MIRNRHKTQIGDVVAEDRCFVVNTLLVGGYRFITIQIGTNKSMSPIAWWLSPSVDTNLGAFFGTWPLFLPSQEVKVEVLWLYRMILSLLVPPLTCVPPDFQRLQKPQLIWFLLSIVEAFVPFPSSYCFYPFGGWFLIRSNGGFENTIFRTFFYSTNGRIFYTFDLLAHAMLYMCSISR